MSQIKQTLLSLENENNSLIEKNLQRSNFVIDAVNRFNNGLKSLLARTSNILLKHYKQDKKNVLEILRELSLSPSFNKGNSPNFNTNINPNNNNNYTSNINSSNPHPSSIQDKNNFQTVQNKPGVYTSSYNPPPIHPNSTYQKPGHFSQVPTTTKPNDSIVFTNNNMVTSTNILNSKLPVVSQHLGNNYTSLNTSNITNLAEKSKRKIRKYVEYCEQGQYFEKRNFSSDGGEEKWILLTKTEIRWATDESKINKKGQYQSYLLKDIKGILYGK